MSIFQHNTHTQVSIFATQPLKLSGYNAYCELLRQPTPKLATNKRDDQRTGHWDVYETLGDQKINTQSGMMSCDIIIINIVSGGRAEAGERLVLYLHIAETTVCQAGAGGGGGGRKGGKNIHYSFPHSQTNHDLRGGGSEGDRWGSMPGRRGGGGRKGEIKIPSSFPYSQTNHSLGGGGS